MKENNNIMNMSSVKQFHTGRVKSKIDQEKS